MHPNTLDIQTPSGACCDSIFRLSTQPMAGNVLIPLVPLRGE